MRNNVGYNHIDYSRKVARATTSIFFGQCQCALWISYIILDTLCTLFNFPIIIIFIIYLFLLNMFCFLTSKMMLRTYTKFLPPISFSGISYKIIIYYRRRLPISSLHVPECSFHADALFHSFIYTSINWIWGLSVSHCRS